MSEGPRSHETVEQVVEEFKSFVRDAFAAYSFARWGLLREHKWAMGRPLGGSYTDPTIHIGAGLPDEPVTSYTRWTVPAARNQLEPEGGPIHRQLVQQLIVFISTGWESEYRGRLARAHGCATDDLKAPILDELRYIRHDVIHHRGMATSQNSGRCEVLRHWVTYGESIYVGSDQIQELWKLFPWHEFRARP